MEINKTNNLKYNYSHAFTGKEDKPAPDENERPNSYEDKSANDAVTNTGKAFLHRSKNDDEVELPQSIKDSLVRDENDTDETFKQREQLAKKLYANRKEFSIDEDELKKVIKYGTTSQLGGKNKDIKARLDMAEIVYLNKNFPTENALNVLLNLNAESFDFIKELIENEDFPNEYVLKLSRYGERADKDFRRKLCYSDYFPKERIAENLKVSWVWTNPKTPDKVKSELRQLHERLCTDEELDFPKEFIADIIESLNFHHSEDVALRRIKFAEKLCTDKDFPKDKIKKLLYSISEKNMTTDVTIYDFAEKIVDCKYFAPETMQYILVNYMEDSADEWEGALEKAPKEMNRILQLKSESGNPRFIGEQVPMLAINLARYPQSINKFIEMKNDSGNYRFNNGYDICILAQAYEKHPKEIDSLFETKDENGNYKFDDSEIVSIANAYNLDGDFTNNLTSNKDFSDDDKLQIIMNLSEENIYEVKNAFNNYKKLEITPSQVVMLAKNYDNDLSAENISKLNKKIGYKNASKLDINETKLAYKLRNAYKVQDINELSIKHKRDLLKNLVSSNTDLFNATDTIKELFPLVPTNQEEYCSILPALVRSIGIETNELTEQRTGKFNKDLLMLSSTLKEVSDEDFANLDIKQEYSKDEFIKDVLSKVKDLPKNERQKVYDYFGFELHHNKKTNTGYDIAGYPVNLNNGKKLAQIDNPQTKAVVENLRENVVRFSENNRIKCNNTELEESINNVVDVLPELRPQIGKKQHGSHEYDVFMHSLKVMQKISQDPNFETLNDSDKKVMLLASLLHDITKKECYSDPTHAAQSSFDAIFISKKFNLSKKEELKLYTLIRNHEWLGKVNVAKTEQQRKKRLQSVAYDLQHDNNFDLSLMFTHADLKAVKKDDSFHDKREGKSRIDFDGDVRSFGESADLYAVKIKENIEELKKSQPILPTTKLPKASKIDEKITTVNSDGSTNIKGVYKNKDGLVIIKYNEVEDWEAIGLPKGSISRGIHVPKGTKGDAELNEDVDTGNIKFIVHGLDYENQLAKFDAFSLLDSDALLSVSYTERPESKYRFFRPQGVILDVDTEYIHGGGNTDAGSGCGKNINEFKRNYIFGGERESDRIYISKLIKDTTGMSDEEYVKFVEKNKNKPMNEVEPPEIRNEIIKAFSTINSNTRKGKREYNEMYISNPNGVNAVFAYNIDYNENIGNPVDFLARTELGEHEKGYNGADSKSVYDRTKFLQEYALKNDLPFVVFGD